MVNSTPELTKQRNDFIIHPVSDEELERRWNAASAAMKEKDIDVLVVVSRTDLLGGYVRWFTANPVQSEYIATCIFYQDKDIATVFSDYNEMKMIPSNHKPNPWNARGIARGYNRGYFSSLSYTNTYDAEIVVFELKKRGKIRVGLVGTSFMPLPYYNYLMDNLPDAEFVDFTDEIDYLRAIKSEEEIEMCRETSKMQDEMGYILRKFIRPGITENDIIAEMRYQLTLRGSEQGIPLVGSDGYGKPTYVMDPHFHNKRKLEMGDNIVVIPEFNGPSGMYSHEVFRFSLGEPHPGLLKLFETCNVVYDHLLSLIKPGADCNEILREYNKFNAEMGLAPESRLLAHGMGYDFVERPAVVPGNGETIRIAENMDIGVHPGVGGEGGLCYFGSNYIVRKDGLEPLHHYPFNELYIIE